MHVAQSPTSLHCHGRQRPAGSSFKLLAAPLILWSFSACGSAPEGGAAPDVVASITLSPSAPSLQGLGDTIMVSATVVGTRSQTLSTIPLVWSTSDPTVATVVGAGQVASIVSVGRGSASIIARPSTPSGPSAAVQGTAVVHVSADLRGISTSVSSVALDFRASRTRTVAVSATADKGVTVSYAWTTSDPTIVSLSINMRGDSAALSAVGAGQAIVSVRGTSAFGDQRQASIAVSVSGQVRGITVSPDTASVAVGHRVALTANVDADPGIAPTVQWRSSNPSVASVASSGEVTALAVGTASISATSTADTSIVGRSTIAVHGVRTVTLDRRSLQLAPGEQALLSATVIGEAGFPLVVLWSSRNAAVATVSGGGAVTAVSPGTTTVIATALGDSSARDSALVTVAIPEGPQAVVSWQSVLAPAMTGFAQRWFDYVEDVAFTPTGALLVAADCGLFVRNGSAFTPVPAVGQCTWRFQRTGSELFWLQGDGIVLRWLSGTTFVTQNGIRIPTRFGTSEIWVAPNGDVFAAGFHQVTREGAVERMSGGAWSPLDAPNSTREYLSIWGTSATDVVVGGYGGLLARFDGTQWTSITGLPAQAEVRSIWSSGDGHYYIAAGPGGAWRLSGTQLTQLSVSWVHRVRGTGPSDVVFAGCGLSKWNGLSWQPDFSSGAIGHYCYGPWGIALHGNEVAHSSGAGIVRAHDRGSNGASISNILSINPAFLDVAVTSPSHAVAVGDWGQVARWDGTAWRSEVVSGNGGLLGVASFGATQTWGVGFAGIFFSSGPGSWQQRSTLGPLTAIWGSAPDNVWAVGQAGRVLRFDGVAWRAMDASTTSDLSAVWGTGPSDVFIGDVNGTVMHYDGTAFSSLSTGFLLPIAALHGTASDNVYAGFGGRGGGMVRFDGKGWSPVSQASGAFVTSIWANAPTDVYAAAASCLIRLAGGRSLQQMECSNLRHSPTWLQALDGIAQGGAVAVGLAGRIVLGRGATGGFYRTTGTTRLAPARLAPIPGRELDPRRVVEKHEPHRLLWPR